ncbi:MAG TPA: A24 family peptidase [Actinomycetaceae bacterium]|nr:A24 family peptidase [Actinomycetaceae bacterium]
MARDRAVAALGALVFGAGGGFAGAGIGFSWWHAVAGALLGGVLGHLAVTDAVSHTLPNRVQYPAFVALTAYILIARLFGVHNFWSALAGAVGVGIVFLILAVAVEGGLGMGDVKLGAILGLWTGWLSTNGPIVFVAAAFLVGGLWALFLMATKRADRHSRIAFGPFLIIGAAIATWLGVL